MVLLGFEPKTYVITAAQGIQSPYSANMYGREARRGRPIKALVATMEGYAEMHDGDLKICAVPGSYVNEFELHPFFHERGDTHAHPMAVRRNEQNKIKEQSKRDAWEENGWVGSMPMHYFWQDIPETEYDVGKVRFNQNTHLLTSQTPMQNKDPLSGKKGATAKYKGNSFIMPATQQIVEPVAKGMSDDFPRLMMTTGACTEPSYNTANQRGEEAYYRHEYGCAVVDVVDNKQFIPRLVPAMKNGTLIDLGIKYSPNLDDNTTLVEKAITEFLLAGDPHVINIDPVADKATEEQMNWLQPRVMGAGDVFDGQTVNRHEIDDEIREMLMYEAGVSSLEEELVLTGDWMKRKGEILSGWDGKLILPWDNHAQFLYKWLANGKYKNDKINKRTAYRLLGNTGLTKENVLEVAIKEFVDLPDNIRFLGPTDDYFIRGVQCGAHGHLGRNGAPGNLKALIEAFGRVIHGHTHQWEQRQGSASAGTLAKRPMDYQKGQPSTSMVVNVALYESGLLQGLPVINGMWHKPGFTDCLESRLN